MPRLLTTLLLTLAFIPAAHAAPHLNALLFPDRTAALVLIAALFYCGFKWRAR